MSKSDISSRVSVRSICLSDDLRAAVQLARTCEFRGVQLDMEAGALALHELDGSGRREVRQIVSQQDLEIESVRAQVPTESVCRAADHDRLLWMMQRAIEATAGIGAKCMCVDIGRLPGVSAAKRPAPGPLANPGLIIIPEPVTAGAVADADVDPRELGMWDGIDAVMREIGALADRAGVMLAFEAELSGFASLQRMLEGARCPWFGVDLDPISVLRESAGVDRTLDLVGPMLHHVRARDGVRGSGGRTQPAEIGRGSTDWRELLSQLDAGSFGGWLTVDTV